MNFAFQQLEIYQNKGDWKMFQRTLFFSSQENADSLKLKHFTSRKTGLKIIRKGLQM